MIEKEKPLLEYNLSGGLFLTIREKDFKNLCQEVVEAGYDYGCVLPFRALETKKGIQTLENSPLAVVHIEEAWNPTDEDNLAKAVLVGLMGYAKKFLGDQSLSPVLQDSLFPSKQSCQELFKQLIEAFPQAKFISHKVDVNFPSERLLIEITPGISLSSSEILDLATEKGVGLVFDPSHLLPSGQVVSFPGKPTRRPGGEWEAQFEIFRKKVEVVDIKSFVKGDVEDLLKGRGPLKELAAAAGENNVRFLRVEIPLPPTYQFPFSPLQKRGLEYLREIGQSLKEA